MIPRLPTNGTVQVQLSDGTDLFIHVGSGSWTCGSCSPHFAAPFHRVSSRYLYFNGKCGHFEVRGE